MMMVSDIESRCDIDMSNKQVQVHFHQGKQRHLRTIAAGNDCATIGPNLVRDSGASDAINLVAPLWSMARSSIGLFSSSA